MVCPAGLAELCCLAGKYLIARLMMNIVYLANFCSVAVKCGANPLTLSGLSGVGDLILTCTGDLSRCVLSDRKRKTYRNFSFLVNRSTPKLPKSNFASFFKYHTEIEALVCDLGKESR
jgi:hypothetical protein